MSYKALKSFQIDERNTRKHQNAIIKPKLVKKKNTVLHR